MKISILAVQSSTQTSKAGKPYQQLEVTYKNLTFNKVESKKLMPFGENKSAFDTLANAKAGEVFDVEVVKNAAGYNDWPSVKQASPDSVDVPTQATTLTKGQTTTVKSTYETHEERAKKQVYIIRQSSLTNAINTLTPGTKSALSFDAVTSLAQQYASWVLMEQEKVNTTFSASELADFPNDIDVE